MPRLFFALWPEDAVRAALAGTAAGLQRDCGGRPPSAENLHLTLAFLGDVPESRLPELFPVAAVAAASATPFVMTLDRIGWWPRQQLVWACPQTVPPPLQSMADILAGALRAAGFRVEKRRFRPHVTLLRDARQAPPRMACSLPPWQVSRMVLLCSERGSRGPRYRSAGEWLLSPGL